MATIHFRDIAKTAILNAIKTDIDAGAAAGYLRIYSGAMPATPETTATGILLAELRLSYPMGTISGSGSSLALALSAITQDSSADNTGVAGYARFLSYNAVTPVAVFDCDVTATGSGGTLQLNTTSIVAGGPVLVTSFTISVP